MSPCCRTIGLVVDMCGQSETSGQHVSLVVGVFECLTTAIVCSLVYIVIGVFNNFNLKSITERNVEMTRYITDINV